MTHDDRKARQATAPRANPALAIRAARLEDAADIAGIHVASWQHVYRGHFPDDYLDTLSVDRRRALWETVLRDGHGDVGVALLDDRIVGFVSLAESRDRDATAGTGELTAIYLDPGCWRRGLGRALMDWARHVAREHAWLRMTLWVLRDNAGARAFYEAMGWRLEGGEQIEVIGDVDARELRYVVDLST